MLLRLGKVALVIACLAGVVWLVLSLEPGRILATARSADPVLLVLSLVPLAARFLIWGYKATRIARRYGTVRYRTVLRLILAGAFINLVTPTVKVGGGLYRAAGIRRETGWEFSRAWGWSLADQAGNILGGLFLFGITAVATGVSRLVWAGSAAILAVLLFLLVRPWLWRIIRGKLRSYMAPIIGPENRTGTLAAEIGLAALSWSMLCLACAMVFQALGAEAAFLELSAVLAVGTTAGVLVGAGGLGVTELTLISLFTRAGIDPAAAAAGTLLHRGILYAVLFIAGGLALLWSRRTTCG